MDYVAAAYLAKVDESLNVNTHTAEGSPPTPFDVTAELIDTLTQATNKKRQQIVEKLNRKHEFDLMNGMKGELGEEFVDKIATLMMPPVEFLCTQLHSAMDGKNTNKETLVEILCTKSNEEMHEIVAAYETKYCRPLAEQICNETSGHFRRLLTLIVTGVRDPNGKVNTNEAKDQAAALFAAIETKLGTDEEAFYRIMSHASFAQLRLVFDEYKQLSGQTIEQAIKREMEDTLQDALLAIVECVQSPAIFFANRLNKAMECAETDDSTLIRICLSRSEIDLDAITKEFERIYNRTLLSAIESETSGINKHTLTGLIKASKWFKYMA